MSNTRSKQIKPASYSRRLRDIARTLYLRNMTVRAIAEELEIGKSTVARWCADLLRSKERAWAVSEFKSSHPRACRARARRKMERRLKRPLHRKEHVHHKDLNYANNAEENLAVLSEREHCDIHRVRKYRGQSNIPAGALPF